MPNPLVATQWLQDQLCGSIMNILDVLYVFYFPWYSITAQGRWQKHTSPRLLRKMISPRFPLRCWIGCGKRTGATTSIKSPVFACLPKSPVKSWCGNMSKGECRHIVPLNSCSTTGTPDVAIAQQGFNASIIPVGTTRCDPWPPAACNAQWNSTLAYLIC